MKIKLQSIRTKILFMLAVFSLPFLLFSGLILKETNDTATRSKAILTQNATITKAAQEAFSATQSGYLYVYKALLIADPKELETFHKYRSLFQGSIIQSDLLMSALTWGSESEAFKKSEGGLTYTQWIRRDFHKKFSIQNVPHEIQQITGAADIYYAGFSKYGKKTLQIVQRSLRFALEGNQNEANQARHLALNYLQQAENFAGQAQETLDKLTSAMDQLTKASHLEIEESLTSRIVYLALLGLCAILTFFAIAWFSLSRILVRPLENLAKATQAIALGNYNQSIEITSRDEFQDLAYNLMQMRDAIKGFTEKLEEKVRSRTAELEKALRDLKNTQAQLIQAAKLATVGQLASGVAHEINNPLQAISGNLETIELIFKEGGSPEELREITKELNVATTRCKEIVEGLLRFARRPTSLEEEVHLEEAIQEALALTRNQLDKGHIQVEKTLPPKIPTIVGNTRGLMQVFVNFITNAIRAMSESEKKSLRISAKIENGKILVSFQDTGCGISKEILPRIFEPFFTTSYKEAEGKMKGTGLGLSISQRIIEEHHGKIEVQSEVQKGSTFTVILPC